MGKKKYDSLQSIADTFVMETQKFSSVALELKFGGSEEADDAAPADKKLEDDDAAGKEDDAAPPSTSKCYSDVGGILQRQVPRT